MIITEPDIFVTLAVSDKPHYFTSTMLLNVPVKITCGYNTRNKMRWVIVTDINNTPVLPQTFLKQGKVCQFNFHANRLGLSYSITIKPKDKNFKISDEYDYLNWSNDFEMLFVGRSQSKENARDKNWRNVRVGNQ